MVGGGGGGSILGKWSLEFLYVMGAVKENRVFEKAWLVLQISMEYGQRRPLLEMTFDLRF